MRVSTKKKVVPAPLALETFFEEALSQIAEAIVVVDCMGRVQYMNAAAEQTSGWAALRALGKLLSTVLSIVDAASGADFAQAINEAQLSAVDSYRRALLLGCEQHPKIIDYRVTAIAGESSSPVGCIIVFRDLMQVRISEKALEISAARESASVAALLEERERARVTLNSIGDAVLSTDFRGRVTFLNANAETLTGWTLSLAAGCPLDEVFPLFENPSRARIACPAMRAIIEDDTCRSGSAEVLVRRDGSEIPVDHSTSPIHDATGGVIGVVMVAHDVTAARNQADNLARLALYDGLTNLPNRTLLSDRLAQALHGAQRNRRLVAVLFVDLDRFKLVNDTDGHAVGDRLLQLVAQRLLACVRSTDTVTRHGGDEFVVLLPDVHCVKDAEVCGANIVAALNKPFTIEGRQYNIGASVGIASQPASPGDLLLKHADIAMYTAKSSGRNRVVSFSQEMKDESEHRLAAHCSG